MKKRIEVFLRHCYYSKLQELPDRTRPEWFNKIKVFENFKNTLDPNLVNYTIIYDEFYGALDKTFLAKEKNVEIINCGSECDSFLNTLDIIQSKNFENDQIVYLLEDDYLHRPGWCDILLEGFEITTSYLTLYDFDYFVAKGYLSEIFVTKNSHWRAVPATTNTFACKYKTLLEDLKIHQKYSSSHAIKEEKGFHFSKDYDKFWELQEKERYLISAMPGWATHCDANHLSPIINWEKIMLCSRLEDQEKIFEFKYS
jgi:hypothetical protein|tara:strand:+ start:1586 stop:2353 length:768 start_codon:yes stop_codon:yes gene_type:complete